MTRTALASLALVTVLALAGCSAAASSSGDYASSPDELGAPQAIENGSVAYDGTKSEESTRSEIITGTMTVTAEEPIEAAAKAIRLVEAAGGRIDGRQEYAPVNGDRGSATLVLRIPSTKVDATVDKLKELGEVEAIEISAVDVTAQVEDIDARIRALEASVDRLTTLLTTATDVKVLIEIESSLSQRQGELESMLTQQRSIGDSVSMATLTLALISVADAPVDPPVTFLTGLETGWNSFTTFISGMVVVFGVLLPWIVFFGLITFAILYIVRLRRRLTSKSVDNAP